MPTQRKILKPGIFVEIPLSSTLVLLIFLLIEREQKLLDSEAKVCWDESGDRIVIGICPVSKRRIHWQGGQFLTKQTVGGRADFKVGHAGLGR